MKDIGSGALFDFPLDGWWIWSVVFGTKILLDPFGKAFILWFSFLLQGGVES